MKKKFCHLHRSFEHYNMYLATYLPTCRNGECLVTITPIFTSTDYDGVSVSLYNLVGPIYLVSRFW